MKLMDSPPRDSPRAPPATDSFWFWSAAFSLMALAGLAAIAGKFDVRQRQIEGRFLGRQRAATERERRAAGMPATDLADTAREPDVVDRGRIVPTWTLAALAGIAAVTSLAMLARERRAATATRTPPPS